jgi:uracil DNA glycosylase
MNVKKALGNLNVHDSWKMEEYISLASEALKKCYELKSKGLPFNPGNSLKEVFLPFSKPCYNFKAIIVGERPYLDSKYSTGIAFNIPFELTLKGEKTNSISLFQKEFNEHVASNLHIDLKFFWETCNILPLNLAITCDPNDKNPYCHLEQWKPFIEKIIEHWRKFCEEEQCMFILIGEKTHYLKKYASNKDLVVTTTMENFNPRLDILYKLIPYIDLPF